MKSISIVMATYNGDKYLKEQLDSIIPYMDKMDELIISDDGSTDETCSIIRTYMSSHSNISLIEGPKKGVVKNFENALFHVKNDIVMFSDQDDVWLPEKLSVIRKVFEENPNIEVVHHDKYICNNEQILNNKHEDFDYPCKRWKHGLLRNLLFSCYFGCCMAMKREFIQSIIPFSDKTIAYDQLVGAIAERNNSSLFILQPLINRRVHGNNMTQKRPYIERIKFRIICIRAFLETIRIHKL